MKNKNDSKDSVMDIENNRMLRKQKLADLGMYPVNRLDLLPSYEKISKADINYLESNTAFSCRVWRNRSMLELAFTLPPALASMLFLFGFIVLNEGRDADKAPLFFDLGFLSLLLFPLLYLLGKTRLICGADWNTNTIWIVRGKKIISYAIDANYISDVLYGRFDTFKHNPMWLHQPTDPMIFVKREWMLYFLKNGNPNPWPFIGRGLASKRDARFVSKKISEFLKNQS